MTSESEPARLSTNVTGSLVSVPLVDEDAPAGECRFIAPSVDLRKDIAANIGMTPVEAHHRVVLSRLTLAAWMAGGFDGAFDDILLRIHSEIEVLERIADEHPSKAANIIVLAIEWTAFREKLRARLH